MGSPFSRDLAEPFLSDAKEERSREQSFAADVPK